MALLMSFDVFTILAEVVSLDFASPLVCREHKY